STQAHRPPYHCLLLYFCRSAPNPPRPRYFFFYCSGAHRDLHSFPTRRSSDLRNPRLLRRADHPHHPPRPRPLLDPGAPGREADRSEEHTSELQSRENLVCRLLLEKKKTKEQRRQTSYRTAQRRRRRAGSV